MQDAISSEKLPSYDSLIIDEAQVLHSEWLKALASWFENKPIIACCDETQVFEYENLSTALDIAQILKADPPYVLSVNLRSPRAVFDRLEETQPAPYQQFSPRNYESDTLTEIAVLNPLEELHRTLKGLRRQGIPKQAIVVVYTKYKPAYDDEIWQLANEVVSIYKFRGLESSVVVVWVAGNTRDTELVCAYARATSRCIVIYDVFALVRQSCDFTRILLNSPSAPPKLFETINSIWPLKNIIALNEVLSKSAKISWSPTWGGWVIEEYDNFDAIAAGLWRDHLNLTSQYPVFYFAERDLSFLVSYPMEEADESPTVSSERLWWCNDCGRWTRYRYDETEHKSICMECNLTESHLPIPENEKRQLLYLDDILSNPKNYSLEQKQQMTLPLFALGCWYTLSINHRKRLAKHLNSDHFAKDALEVLIAIDVIKLKPGSIITLKFLRDRYLDWYPNLMYQVDIEQWKRWTAVKVNSLLSRTGEPRLQKSQYKVWNCWLKKQDTGVYQRLPIPELDE